MNNREKALRLQAEHEAAKLTRKQAVQNIVEAIEEFTDAKIAYARAYSRDENTRREAYCLDETRDNMRDKLAEAFART